MTSESKERKRKTSNKEVLSTGLVPLMRSGPTSLKKFFQLSVSTNLIHVISVDLRDVKLRLDVLRSLVVKNACDHLKARKDD